VSGEKTEKKTSPVEQEKSKMRCWISGEGGRNKDCGTGIRSKCGQGRPVKRIVGGLGEDRGDRKLKRRGGGMSEDYRKER